MSKCHSRSDSTNSLPLFVRLNVSGREYDVPESVARSHVGSLFAVLASFGHTNWEFREVESQRLLATRRITNVQQRWFIERTPAMFEIVLQYVYTRQLHCPPSVCEKALHDELKFWRLKNVPVADCCWAEEEDDDLDLESENFGSLQFDASDEGGAEDEKEAAKELNNMDNTPHVSNGKRLSLADVLKVGLTAEKRQWMKCKRFLWKICHGPSSWLPARVSKTLSLASHT